MVYFCLVDPVITQIAQIIKPRPPPEKTNPCRYLDHPPTSALRSLRSPRICKARALVPHELHALNRFCLVLCVIWPLVCSRREPLY